MKSIIVLGFINCGESVTQLSSCQVLKGDSSPRSLSVKNFCLQNCCVTNSAVGTNRILINGRTKVIL